MRKWISIMEETLTIEPGTIVKFKPVTNEFKTWDNIFYDKQEVVIARL